VSGYESSENSPVTPVIKLKD
jgi:hypothetical protein